MIGHEFMAVVEDVGSEVNNIRKGDRVTVPSVLPPRPLFALRQHQPQARDAGQAARLSTAGISGYTHAFGGYAGAHAEYVRVPHADVDCFKVPDGVTDEQALFISMGADFCNIHRRDTVAVWGCGGVGLMAQ